MATITDVARAAGVSRATVSLVSRASPLVAERTRQRVERAMVQVGYVSNRSAANLRYSYTNTVGLIIPDISNPLYSELLAGAEEVLDSLDKKIFIAAHSESIERQSQLLSRMLEMQVDGLILCAASGTTAEMLSPYARMRIPIVQVLRAVDPDQLDYSGTDNRKGVRQATQHLIDLGHRRIGFIGSAIATSISQERHGGYREALERAGIEPAPEWMKRCAPTIGDAATTMRALLSRTSAPTAVVCFNDIIAFGATLGIFELGLKPGRDVSVMGFGDIAWAQSWRPALTTMSINVTKIGRAAADLLKARMSREVDVPRMALSEASLIVRDTCARPSS